MSRGVRPAFRNTSRSACVAEPGAAATSSTWQDGGKARRHLHRLDRRDIHADLAQPLPVVRDQRGVALDRANRLMQTLGEPVHPVEG